MFILEYKDGVKPAELSPKAKYQDMHDRLDILYDRISELEDTIAEIEEKISGAYGEKITADELYKVLLSFDRMYFNAGALTVFEGDMFLKK